MQANPVTGAGAVLRGFALIARPGLRRYVAVPLAFNVVLFAAALWYALAAFGDVVRWVEDQLPGWLDWLGWLLWPLFVAALLVVVFYSFTLVANLVAAPFNGLLAEKVEAMLTGRPPETGPGDWKGLLRELPAALSGELRKLVYLVLWSIPFLLLFLVPVVNVVAPLAWLAFSAWMLAVEYTDFPMGNHGLDFRTQRARLRGQRLLSLGFGSAVLAGTLLPVVNWFIMPAAVAGATVLWVERFASTPGSE